MATDFNAAVCKRRAVVKVVLVLVASLVMLANMRMDFLAVVLTFPLVLW